MLSHKLYIERKKKYTLQNERGEEALNTNHRAYIVRLPQLQLMPATSLRSKRFQSRYRAKVGAGAKKNGRGRERGEEETLARKPHDSGKCPLIFHGSVHL